MRTLLTTLVLMVAGFVTLPSPASAELTARVGAGLELGLGEVWEDLESGWGFQADVAYSVALPLVSAAGGAFVGYGQIYGEGDLSLTQALALGRLTLNLPLALFFEAGIGWAWARGEGDDWILAHDGLSWLLGGGVEYCFGLFHAGVHADYKRFDYDDGGGAVYEWMELGLQARVGF